MPTLSAITLLFNSLTLALSLGFLLIILWHDAQKPQNQFFAAFLIMVLFWNTGSLLVQISALTQAAGPFVVLAVSVMEIGFAGSSIACYALATVLVGIQTQRFRVLAFMGIGLIVTYRAFLIVNTPQSDLLIADGPMGYNYHALTVGFYMLFNLATIYIMWHFRRRIESRVLIWGVGLFVLGQTLVFFNPDFVLAAVSTNIGALGTLIISGTILQHEIIGPLNERNSQVESMHSVSLAITSQTASDKILDEIARQAAGWLRADGTGIFLSEGKYLTLATVYNLPAELQNTYVSFGQGVAGTVATTRQSLYLENYARDWTSSDDFGMARSSFGSVICVPLSYGEDIIGALFVVSGKQGRLFNQQDVRLTELIAAQAAVAIAHGRLFSKERALRGQLEAVLTSTENPVIAVDRKLHVIFANPVAESLFRLAHSNPGDPIHHRLPSSVFPDDFRHALRTIRRKNVYVYEVNFDSRTFLCHLAILGRSRIDGWVAVLNDVTELKELDRLKSEMVRMASHDLKNPLMGAMAYLDLLAEELEESGLASEDSERSYAIQMIEKQLGRMDRIIRGILDVERLRLLVETQEEFCDPRVVIQHCVEELDFQIKEAGIDLEVEIEDNVPSFIGNVEQFERALVNLVENAIKFSLREERHIHIKAYLQESEIVFEVADRGVGIPENMQDRVFDRFFRAEQDGVQHVTGSGLGLSLVKAITESQGGRVWLKSQEGVGTTFYIAVPAATHVMQ